MVFTSPVFLVFLTIVLVLYWHLPHRGQNLLLLVSSLIFYGWWDWRFLGLLLFTAGIDFLIALRLDEEADPRRRRLLLVGSLLSNLGVLGFFKYFNFFVGSAQTALGGLGVSVDVRLLQIVLPVGISFYTFQALSYTIDVYRRDLRASRDIVEYLAFIAFFPQLVAGPIERATHLLPQMQEPRSFDETAAADGARQMLWGFFKKMVVADSLAGFVDVAYYQPALAGGWTLLWATYAFAFQIYCDFSGYTDIAIGCARLFGVSLSRNFAYPYFSRDIPEFWRRWHISLSTWFRDYVFIPLGGSRVPGGRRIVNVLAVFLLSGLWHGANWTFVAWGALHGAFYCVSLLIARRATGTASPHAGLGDWWRILLTFHLACLAWVFFRAPSVTQAGEILSLIAGDVMSAPFVAPPLRLTALVALLVAIEWWQRREGHALTIAHWPVRVRWAAYYTVVVVIVLLSRTEVTPFIYFQF